MPDKASQSNRASSQPLPKMTVSITDEYIEATASVVAHAVMPSTPWRIIFGNGKQMSNEQRLQTYYNISKEHLDFGAKSGAFIAEAGGFSACALWFPPGTQQESSVARTLIEMEQRDMTLRESFDYEVEKIKAQHICSRYGQQYWQLALLARDPRKPAIPGAVRAVLQPFMEQAADENKPMWLVTTNNDAKDMYMHFGWQLVDIVTIGELSQWCLILYPPLHDSHRNRSTQETL